MTIILPLLTSSKVLWAFLDYLDDPCFTGATEDALGLLQLIADVIMQADFDDKLHLEEGGMSLPGNARAVLDLVEDMELTRVQIDELWEESAYLCLTRTVPTVC